MDTHMRYNNKMLPAGYHTQLSHREQRCVVLLSFHFSLFYSTNSTTCMAVGPVGSIKPGCSPSTPAWCRTPPCNQLAAAEVLPNNNYYPEWCI